MCVHVCACRIPSLFAAMPAPPGLVVTRHLVGSGHEWGGLTTEITSHAPHTTEVFYLEMVPWFCRLYLHTLSVSGATVLHQHYVPAKDRQRAHMLELHLSLPPLSTSSLSLQFNRAFLKWTEHKPDAHHGFYIKSVRQRYSYTSFLYNAHQYSDVCILLCFLLWELKFTILCFLLWSSVNYNVFPTLE